MPAWFAITKQVPDPLFIVYVAPALVHEPVLVKLTGNSELAVADTVKLVLYVTLEGGLGLKVIVWLCTAFTTCPPLNVPVLVA